MTREQAINYLISSGFTHEQVGEVVRALTYEPTTKNNLGVDCISRQAVIDGIKEYFHDEYYQRTSIQDCRDCFIEDVLNNLPSVTPQLSVSEVTALAEWTEKLTKASEDAYNKGYADGMKEQEPRKGHWIYIRNSEVNGLKIVKCSECGKRTYGSGKYCPNCGSYNGGASNGNE